MLHQVMPEVTAQNLVKAAHRGAPKEICGFIMRDFEIIEIANVHENPERQFAMDVPSLLSVMQARMAEVRGIFHSHPRGNAEPSSEDIELWHYAPYQMRYWVVTLKDVYEWELDNVVAHPIRRDGTRGARGMAYPVLALDAAVRQAGHSAPLFGHEGGRAVTGQSR